MEPTYLSSTQHQSFASFGKDVFAEPTIFQNEVRLDIRRWDSAGFRLKEGISIPFKVWKSLMQNRARIMISSRKAKNRQIYDEPTNLEDSILLRYTPNGVDIRKLYQNQSGEFCVSMYKGLLLDFDQMEQLNQKATKLTLQLADLNDTLCWT